MGESSWGGASPGRASLGRVIALVLVLFLLARPRPRPGGSPGGGGGNPGIFEPAVRWLRRKVQTSGRHHHVFRGEVRRGRGGQMVGSGYHHRFMGQDWADRRITRVVRTGSNGTYSARVQMKGPNGQWVDKPADSSFFPDNWTPQQVDRTIRDAFQNGREVPGTDGRRWRGEANGILVEGSYKRSSRNWDSAWPVVD
ncbi:EndoU domain-containing protein [Actinomadura rugatobispora]|uniref:EndoU domain-containing protein n=1 Tax=Actinomadura rugatobispora TaxID=1994 RepID=A0ABW0ZW55_9ACTN|nr:hypothetical protein GCM10010200_050430 [Actinomadura rugatobispora]